MKFYFTFFLIIGVSFMCLSQKFTMNQGHVLQKNYFSVIHYENINDKLIISVEIDGKKRRFILDTGAPNAITKTLSDELNAEIIKKIPVSDQAEKRDSLTVVSVNKMILGDILFEGVPALVLDNNSRIIVDCLGVDGFIGSNMLRNSIVQFDSKNKTITLTDNSKNLSLDKRESTPLKLDFYQSNPLIQIKVKKDKMVKESLLLDTGANTFYDLSLNSFNVFQKNGVVNVLSKSTGSDSYGLFGVISDSTKYRVTIPEISINKVVSQNVISATTIGNQSLIGAKLLDYGIATVDYKNRKFYFKSFETINNLEEKLFPINFSSKDGKLVVGVVWDEELAEKLHAGDLVVEVDGVNYENKSFCDLLLNPSPIKGKDKLTLMIKSETGAIKKVAIYRK